MPISVRWRTAAFAACTLAILGASAAAIRAVVASERMADGTSLAVTAGTVLALAAVTLVAFRSTLRRVGWRARLTAAVLPAGLLVVCGGFVFASIPDASVEMEAIVEARGPGTPAAAVELGPKGDDVRLSGELQQGTARRLAALLATHPAVTRIHLTSEGGLADEGQALGDVIAAHGLTTYVPDYCVSACTLAFVRGRERLVLDDSRVGFHSPFEEGLFGSLYQGDSSEQRAEYLAAGVAGDFVDAALKVKPDDIWYPKAAQLIAARVATAVVARDRLPDSNLDGTASLEGARAAVLHDFPVLGAFRARSPAALDKVARWYLDAYERARPESENGENLRAIVNGAVLMALSRADDRALVAAGRFLQRGMAAAAEADDPETCVRIGVDADLVEAEAQLGGGDATADAQAAAIVAAAVAGSRALKSNGDGGPLAALAGGDDGDDDAGCAAVRGAYDALLQRPTGAEAVTLRALADARALDALKELKGIVARH